MPAFDSKDAIQYRSPKASLEAGEDPQHRFDLFVNDEKIGAAEITYYSKPLPLCQINELYVEYEHKGNGYASAIMDQVELFLKNKKKPGVLTDAILPDDQAQGMYERRGWRKVPHSLGLYVYNWPQNVPLSLLDGFAFRSTDPLERQFRQAK